MMMEKADSVAPDADAGVNERIARRVRELRTARGYSLDVLATRSGVSRSMISLIERAAASPTAVVLEKLATGLDIPLAGLFGGGREDAPVDPLVRRARQPIWRDPESGYMRRNISPPGWPSPLHLVEVEFPPGARIAYEVGPRENVVHQQIWMLKGRIDLMLGEQLHELREGDCLAMQLDQPLIYSNPTRQSARYIVAICSEPAPPGGRSAQLSAGV